MNPRPALSLLVLAAHATAQSWTQLMPAPYPNTMQRRAGGIAFDPVQGKLLMYGGLQSGPSLVLGDTWTFDGTTWTQLSPATVPPCAGDTTWAVHGRPGAERQRRHEQRGARGAGQLSG